MRLKNLVVDILVVAAVIVLLSITGCASKKFVRSQVTELETRTTETTDVLQSQIERDQMKLAEHEEQLAGLSATAREALDRAVAAGQLAEGKFLFETILSDDKVRFAFDSATVSDEAADALSELASQLVSSDDNVYIEIQGHTDSIGSDAYNEELGQARAESIRRYLNREHGFALHRMSVISYGEAMPIADNSTPAGRSLNRRVGLVVLK